MARAMLSDVFTDHLREQLPPTRDAEQLESTVAFLVNGLLGLLTWWLDRQVALSADEIHTRFAQLATHGVAPLLNISTQPTSR